jgi:hypothetical protein
MFCGTLVGQHCFGRSFLYEKFVLVGLKGLQMLLNSSWSNCAIVNS